MSGSGHEVGAAARQPGHDPENSIVKIIEPTGSGPAAEGIIAINPPVIVGTGLARAMQLMGFASHGATFEHVIAGTEHDELSYVLVTTTTERAPSVVPGDTGHSPRAISATDRWHAAVASLLAFLNDPGPG